MDQVELVAFDSTQERWRHYNGEAYEDGDHLPRMVLSVRPLTAASA